MSETMTAHEALLVAEALSDGGRLAESQDAFVALLGSEVRPAALLGLAMLSTRNGDADIARALLEQSLGADRDNPPALYELALVHARAGQRDQAVALLGEALSHDPRHGRALSYLTALADEPFQRAQGSAAATPSAKPGTPPAPQGPSGSPPPLQPRPARPPEAPHDPSAIVGVARNVNRGVGPWRGKPAALQIWSFRVQTYDAAGDAAELLGVEMRGHEIRGTLDDGDWVEIAERPKAGEGCRPKKVRNLTTNDLVQSRMRFFNAQ